MKLRPIVHIDCDGPLSEFDEGVIELINRHKGTNYTKLDVTGWDVLESLGCKDAEWVLDDAITHHFFCLNLKVVPGAKEAIEELRSFCDVYCLTAPYHLTAWPGQRSEWLKSELQFDKDHIIQTHAKHLSFGHMFLDDRLKNIVKWQEQWPESYSFLWNTPGNRNDQSDFRVESWPEFVKFAKDLATWG